MRISYLRERGSGGESTRFGRRINRKTTAEFQKLYPVDITRIELIFTGGFEF